MKRIKTTLGNRLITQKLDYLMQISINGPLLNDFDFNKAATLLGATSDKEASDMLNKKLSETCTYRGGKVVPPQLF